MNDIKEAVQRAIDICKKERYMREAVFKNRPEKKADKVKEMDYVIDILEMLYKHNESLRNDLLEAYRQII